MERFAIIAVTQPLHVVVVRSMASFVGQESDYNNVFSGLLSIYKENGTYAKHSFPNKCSLVK